MARVTVEDCIEKVPNRFELVLLASHRSRQISSGSPITLDRDNDKNPVVALREIADSTVPVEDLKNNFVGSMQKHVENDQPEEDDFALMLAGRSMAEAAAVAGAIGEDLADAEGMHDDSGDDLTDED